MRGTARPSGRGTAVVAAGAAAVTVLLAGWAVWLSVLGTDAGGATGSAKPVLLALVLVVPGLVVTAAQPRNALAWLALGEALLFAAAAAGDQWARHAVGTDGGAPTGGDVAWAVWTAERFSAYLVVGVLLVLLLLPDGRLPSRRWRPVVATVVTVQCLAITVFVTTRGPAAAPGTSLPAGTRELANPVGVLPAPVASWVEGLDTLLLQVPLLLALAACVVRLRRADPDERARVVGVLLAASTFVLLVVLGHAWWPELSDLFDVVAGALLAAQLTATVLGRRPRLVADLTRQAFVYTVLTALVAGTAVAIGAVLDGLGSDVSRVGIAVVAGGTALAVHPLRTRLTRLVDRLVHGDLADPYGALQRLADRTHRAPTVDAVLAGLAATVAASLRVPWVVAEAGGHTGAWGVRPERAGETTTDLLSGATRLGTLRVGTGPGRRLQPDELRLLADLGRHGGVAVQAVVLDDAVRAGRQRLVVAREEERRRLRRDLHDEVGPTLAGLAMQLGAVRALVRRDPDAALDRLGRLQEAAAGALGTVRRIAHRLRPPALDDLGLAGAARQLAESLGLRARFPDPDPPRLPAAVEVAAYLVLAEALHNVSRHAGTVDVDVSIRVSGQDLVLEVRDTGAGTDPARPAGVGLQGMRERADELGGSLVVDSVPGRGTTVTARLPAAVADHEMAT